MAHRQKFRNFEPGKTNGELEIHKMSRRDLANKEMVEMKGFELRSNLVVVAHDALSQGQQILANFQIISKCQDLVETKAEPKPRCCSLTF
jgi:hypothetical protein